MKHITDIIFFGLLWFLALPFIIVFVAMVVKKATEIMDIIMGFLVKGISGIYKFIYFVHYFRKKYSVGCLYK